MKSERRHDLQTNELAGTLGSGIEKVQPFVQYVVGGLVIAALAAIGWGVYTSFARKNAAAAWTEYYFTLNTGDAESFKAIADKHPGSAAAVWAQQTAGDEYLADGIDALYRDRGQGTELIKSAIKSFEEVSQAAPSDDLRTRATLGLAQAHEALGEIDKAKDLYQEVISAGLQPAITTVATNRVAFLNSQAGKDFYAWFDKLKPAPAAPPKMPGDLSVPPTSPNLQFDTPALDTSKLELPPAPGTTTAPVAPAPTGADGKPIELPPATTTAPAETPAALATTAPATEVPAADPPKVDPPAPATEAPAASTETPAVPAPAVPAVTEPAAGAPATEAPATEAPATDLPATDLPATDSPAPPK